MRRLLKERGQDGEEVSPPLVISTTIRNDISMEFTVDLLKADNQYVTMVSVDRVCKCARFCTLSHPFAPVVTPISVDPMFKMHAIPLYVALNRDLALTYNFRQDSFKL